MGTVDLVEFDVALAATVAGWPRTADEAYRWCGHREVSADIVAEWSKAEDGRCFALVDAGAPVGYGELWLDEDEVELARLIVAPDRRRQGVGRRLVEALTEVARQYETGLICLRVHPDNTSAVRVYLAAGFASVDDATTAEWNARQPVTYQWLTIGH
jgi:GNAT superfamily N-acetyltransferase